MNHKNSKLVPVLWILTFVFLFGLMFAHFVYPEWMWLSIAMALLLIGDLIALIMHNRAALKTRSAAYGLNSLVTVILVICIVGVLDFLADRYPQKIDLTKNKIHTLSEQTVKLVKGLKQPVKAEMYVQTAQREQYRQLLENYKQLNPKFELEWIDPNREPTRTKQSGVRNRSTLRLLMGARDNKVEDPTEEKLTNALIKLTKDKNLVLCDITGHGERNLSGTDNEGYDSVKKALQNQSYEVKEINLAQETKIPATCDAIAIIGPQKPFFDPEVKVISDYLAEGGRALFALDINLKGGGDFTPELMPMLNAWNVKPITAMVIDRSSRMFNADASVPFVMTFNKDNPITKELANEAGPKTASPFPMSRPIDTIPGAPNGMNVQWLAQTFPTSIAVMDLKEIISGQVKPKEGRDRMGQQTVAVSVEGKQKDSKATRNTRLVVFGTSSFASNAYNRFGVNLDLFMNAASWIMEDESLISIRAKEEGAGKIQMSQKQGSVIALLTIILIPSLIIIAGIAIWVMRKKL